MASESSSKIRQLHRKVGGVWVDVVRMQNGKRVFGVLNLAVSKDGLSLTYGGENINTEGEYTGDFGSRLIESKWPVLRFFYENSHGSDEYSAGVVSLNFISNDRFVGESIDYNRQVPDKIEAWRITDKTVINILTKPETRATQALELFEKFFPKDFQIAKVANNANQH